MTPTERRVLDAAERWYDSGGNSEAELAEAVLERRREQRRAQDTERDRSES